MAAHPRATATKRTRERAKMEKRNEKILRREARKKEKAAGPPLPEGTDPDLVGITPGPQRPLE